MSRRRDSRPGIPRVPGAPRGGPCGRPAARRAQRLAAAGAPRAFASILWIVRGGGERRDRLGQAVAGGSGLQSAWGPHLWQPCSCARVDLGRGESGSHSRSRPGGRCFPGPVNASQEESRAAHFLSLRSTPVSCSLFLFLLHLHLPSPSLFSPGLLLLLPLFFLVFLLLLRITSIFLLLLA